MHRSLVRAVYALFCADQLIGGLSKPTWQSERKSESKLMVTDLVRWLADLNSNLFAEPTNGIQIFFHLGV